jgi:hypothetical protein
MGAIVAAGTTSSLEAGNPRPVAFVNGFHHGLEVAAVIALAGALVAFLTIRKGPGHHEEPTAAAVAEAAH